jgi:hypothetical protein
MTVNERFARDVLNEVDNFVAEGYQAAPRRGDQFEQWLKAQRDKNREGSEGWNFFETLLDDYRLHADTGTPLDQHVCQKRGLDDCAGCHEVKEAS